MPAHSFGGDRTDSRCRKLLCSLRLFLSAPKGDPRRICLRPSDFKFIAWLKIQQAAVGLGLPAKFAIETEFGVKAELRPPCRPWSQDQNPHPWRLRSAS